MWRKPRKPQRRPEPVWGDVCVCRYCVCVCVCEGEKKGVSDKGMVGRSKEETRVGKERGKERG